MYSHFEVDYFDKRVNYYIRDMLVIHFVVPLYLNPLNFPNYAFILIAYSVVCFLLGWCNSDLC
ncbi:hypothetical protein GCM10011383_03380 [Hymenobacter cavernae]|uniref:Uncharacterized protein n=1 Tax=Hymenobacter cavernae TaxID=2044852 RepID=A0ABQ1TI22_9BACT|nr:hypothetical protein GCM10011383_03380 [Hymenobacter cavernae]